MGFKVRYLHSEVDTIERIRVVRELRLGEVDVLVGINLLREGLDLPEVTLVAILDADKEGFLRGETALVQTIGRAARNVDGTVIMYADKRTVAMVGHLRDRPAAHSAAGLQRGARHHAAHHRQGSVRHRTARHRGRVPYKERRKTAPAARRDVGRGTRAAHRRPRGGDVPGRRGVAVRICRQAARRDQRAVA